MFETQYDLLAPGSAKPWPYESVRVLVETRAQQYKAELHAMVEAARRSIGQMTRADNLRERIERERQALARYQWPAATVEMFRKRGAHPLRFNVIARPSTYLTVAPGHRPHRTPVHPHERIAA